MKTAIITDSNSGITQKEAKELGIFVVPMPVLIDNDIFYEDITITQERFYEKLKGNVRVSTSQPTPENVAELWESALRTYEEIVFIPMSSGLSETCHTLQHFAETDMRFKGKVYVIDNQRISVTQRQSVIDAIKLAKDGKSAKEIADWLMSTKMNSSIYIMVDTLKYLKRGGRLTPAVAAIGTILRIKPVLQIQGFKLDTYAKVRKLSDAKETMISAIRNDFSTRFRQEYEDGKMSLSVAHTDNLSEAEKFRDEVVKIFPKAEFACISPLSLSVSCHIGPGALALACSIKL